MYGRPTLGERLIDLGMGLMLIAFASFMFMIVYLGATGQISSGVC